MLDDGSSGVVLVGVRQNFASRDLTHSTDGDWIMCADKPLQLTSTNSLEL